MMTVYRKLSKIIVEFQDREGVPNALIVENPPEDAYAEVVVSDDGLSFDTLLFSQSQDNAKNAFHFKALEDWELKYVRRDGEDGQSVKKPEPLGFLGKIIWSTIGLAILVPFLGILWSWAAGVVRGMGGVW